MFGENVLAVGDYNKADGSRLDPAEWNNLVTDFVNTWQTATMAGPLGIGTNNPGAYKLNVNGNTNITGILTATSFNGTYIGTLNAANISMGDFGSNTGGGNYSFSGSLGVGTNNPYAPLGVRNTVAGAYAEGINLDMNSSVTNSAIGIDFNSSSSDLGTVPGARIQAIRIGSGAPTDLTFSTRNSGTTLNEIIRITNTGYVGIGTNNPGAKLEVNGGLNISATNSINFGNSGPAGVPGGFNWSLSNDSASMYASEVAADQTDYVFRMSDNTTGDRFVWKFSDFRGASYDVYPMIMAGDYGNFYGGKFYINNTSGNVGIGTTNPLSKLIVNTAANTDFEVRNGTDYGAGYSGVAIDSRDDARSVRNMMIIAGSPVLIPFGNVGIGTTAASSKLTVVGGDFELDNNKSIKISSSTANTTVLLGNYADGQGFAYGSLTVNKSASLAVEGDVKANRICIQEDCKAAWSDIVSAGGGNQWTTSGLNILNANTGGVAIGTSTPDIYKLFVNGNTNIAGNLNVTGSITGGAAMTGTLNASNVSAGAFGSNTGGGNFSFSGSVGIGTAGPNYKLEVVGGDIGLDNGKFYRAKRSTSGASIDTVGFPLGTDILTFKGGVGPGTTIGHQFINTGGTPLVSISGDGNVGIGTTDPSVAKLVINAGAGMALKAFGNGIFTGTLQTQTGSDFAEEFSTTEDLEPGTVVVMGDGGYKSVHPCDKEYDSTVVGIVSNNPSIIAGRVISKHKAIIAMMGVVKVNVIDINGKISKGDRLTTSGISGYAMKADDSKPGTIIGKALENLTKKSGEINVLVNLQ